MVDTGLNFVPASMNKRGQIVFRGQKPFTTFCQDTQYIRTIERETGKEIVYIISICNHGYCPVIEHL